MVTSDWQLFVFIISHVITHTLALTDSYFSINAVRTSTWLNLHVIAKIDTQKSSYGKCNHLLFIKTKQVRKDGYNMKLTIFMNKENIDLLYNFLTGSTYI